MCKGARAVETVVEAVDFNRSVETISTALQPLQPQTSIAGFFLTTGIQLLITLFDIYLTWRKRLLIFVSFIYCARSEATQPIMVSAICIDHIYRRLAIL